MPTLSYTQMAQYLANAGFPQDQLAIGAAIGMAESSGQTDIANTQDGEAKGFMQVKGDTSLYDPATCAAAAYKHYQSDGWCDWATWSGQGCSGGGYDGGYAKFLSAAQMEIAGKNITSNPGAGTGSTDQYGTSGAEDASMISDFSDMLKPIRTFFHLLTEPHLWIRVFKVMWGLACVIDGFILLAIGTKTGKKVVQTGVSVGKDAAVAAMA